MTEITEVAQDSSNPQDKQQQHGPLPIFLQDQKLRENLLEAAGEGYPIRMMAESIGVAHTTVGDWLRRGRRAREHVEAGLPVEDLPQHELEYIALVEDYEVARFKAKRELLGKIKGAADKNWTAAAWHLERVFPEDFSKDRDQEKKETKINMEFTLKLGDSAAVQRIVEVKEQRRLASGDDDDVLDADFEIED